MRDDLLKQPDMDYSKMSSKMRGFLRDRDYDAFFFEAIALQDEAFDKQL